MHGASRSLALVAVLVSLLLHGLVALALSGFALTLPAGRDEAPVVAVRLVVPEAPRMAQAAPAVPAPPRPAPRRPAPDAAPASDPALLALDAAEAETAPAAAEPVASEPALPEPPAEPVPARVDSTAEPGLAAAPAVPPAWQAQPLPTRFTMHYTIRYGVASGEQTLKWQSDGEKYVLTSEAQATGLVALFYRGRFVQESRGRITATGLVPEEFIDQRGDRRERVVFDGAGGRLVRHPAQGEPQTLPAPEGIQDAVSVFFQIAATAPPVPRQTLPVMVGKRVREYVFSPAGEVTLDTPMGALRTVHLVRAPHPDGRFEAWLAVDHHYLPVRILRTDEKGNEIELAIRRIGG